MKQLYLLQTEHQCPSTLYSIHLSGPVHHLLDDVSEVVIVLGTNGEIKMGRSSEMSVVYVLKKVE